MKNNIKIVKEWKQRTLSVEDLIDQIEWKLLNDNGRLLRLQIHLCPTPSLPNNRQHNFPSMDAFALWVFGDGIFRGPNILPTIITRLIRLWILLHCRYIEPKFFQNILFWRFPPIPKIHFLPSPSQIIENTIFCWFVHRFLHDAGLLRQDVFEGPIFPQIFSLNIPQAHSPSILHPVLPNNGWDNFPLIRP